MQGLKKLDARRPRLTLFLAYTALFLLLAGVLAGIFAANGRSFIWYGDTLTQHYPALMYYGRWLREAARCLLSGAAVPTWDLSIGYGADIITTLSYYVVGDPLNLLSALVPSQYTEQLLEFLILLRGWLSGLAFLALSLQFRNGRFGSLLGALSYAFCGWFLQTAFMEPIFIVPMYCFPLMLLGAERLFEHKSPAFYIAAVALAALSNFLFFYMEAVLLVVFAVGRYLSLYGVRDLRTLPPLVGRFLAYSLVGIAISCVTLLPTALELFTGARLSADRVTTEYPFAQPWKLLANLTTSANFDSYSTYCGVSALAVLAVFVLFARRGDRLLKAGWLLSLAAMVTPLAGRVLNGFSYAQNRWVWAFALLECFILARVCGWMTELSAPERLRLAGLLAGYLALAFWNREARSEWAFLGAALLLLLAFCLSAAGQARPALIRGVLLAGCCLGIVINIGYTYGADESETLSEYRAPGYVWQVHQASNTANVLKQLEDDTLWRYDSVMGAYANSAMLMDLHGTGYFFSLNNGYLSQWMAELGCNTPEDYNYMGWQGRSLMDSFVGAKYCLAATDSTRMLPQGYSAEPVLAMDVSGVSTGVYEKTDALPIGFTTDTVISRTAYDAMSPIQRQDALLSGVVLETDAGTSPVDSGVIVPGAQITLNGVEQLDATTYYCPQDGGTITFTIAEPVAGAETYFVVQGMDYEALSPDALLTEEQWSAMTLHDRLARRLDLATYWCKENVYLRLISDIGEGRIDYAKRNNQYYCGRHDFAYPFGYTDTGLTTLTVVLPWAGTYTFEKLSIECQRTDTTAQRAAELSAEHLENTVLGTNRIEGDITVNGGKLLVLQIPYSQGWTASVDGTEARILRADTAFMALELTPGSHHIALTYETPGLKYGWAITLTGLAAFAGINLYQLRKTKYCTKPKK